MSPILRKTDLIRRSPTSTTIDILLVGAPLDGLPGIIQRIGAEVDGLLVEGDATVVTLGVGGACFPNSARTALELTRRAEALAQDASEDPGGRLRYRLR
jgi:hypothetical protein